MRVSATALRPLPPAVVAPSVALVFASTRKGCAFDRREKVAKAAKEVALQPRMGRGDIESPVGFYGCGFRRGFYGPKAGEVEFLYNGLFPQPIIQLPLFVQPEVRIDA